MKVIIFIYGVLSYIVGLIGQTWFILYLTKWNIISKNIYSHQETTLIYAILINIFLVLLFGIQHSIMARQWFKKYIYKLMPEAMERSTYVFLSGIIFILICLYWQPIDGIIWEIDNSYLVVFLWFGFIFGWIFSVVATFVINHFELFGLQQVYLNLKNKQPKDTNFQEKLFYKFIRHPIQLGILLGLWITPVMNYGHFILSSLFTIYIFIGLYFEEKDLIKELGDVYINYKSRVGLILPKSFND